MPIITLKALSVKFDQLKRTNVEKDTLIKVFGNKIGRLQNWTQQMYSTLCNKINETDQQHLKKEKSHRK